MNTQLGRGRMQRILWTTVAILIVPAQLSAGPSREPASDATPKEALEIADAVSHPSAGAAVGVVYLKIMNHTNRPDRLIAAETSAAARAEFHETKVDGDFVRMMPRPQGFEIPSAGELVLESGGKHIMLTGLTEVLRSGASIELVLVFEHADRRSVRVPVRPRSF